MNSRGTTNISYIEDYATAHVKYYFLVLLGIMIFGILLNVLPAVRDFVTSIEELAADIVKTPAVSRMNSMNISKSPVASRGGAGGQDANEQTHLLLTPSSSRKYKEYLKKIKDRTGPVLYKLGSMRAGPTLSSSHQQNDQRRYSGNQIK